MGRLATRETVYTVVRCPNITMKVICTYRSVRWMTYICKFHMCSVGRNNYREMEAPFKSFEWNFHLAKQFRAAEHILTTNVNGALIYGDRYVCPCETEDR